MEVMKRSPWLPLHGPYDESPANCSGDPNRLSCFIEQDEEAKRDQVAMVRVIISLLSLLGALSIIITVIIKKQVFSPKIHPIFMLSIADCLLSLTWVVGGALWLMGGVTSERGAKSERVACFTVTLCTVILECVAVNLTLLYALLAYSNIKQKDFNNVYLLFNRDREVHAWKPWKTILAYTIAWFLPMILILIPFLSISSAYHIIAHANNCSCWCLPYYGNVLPYAFAGDVPTSQYLYRVNMLVASYASVVGLHYLAGFVFISIIYWKILRRIRLIRSNRNAGRKRSTQAWYGGAPSSPVIGSGEKRARTRVVAFLTVFVAVGLINTLMSMGIFIATVSDLAHPGLTVVYEPKLSNFEYGIYLLQSCSLPLQGFLNAVVYGWTREDFLQVIASRNIQDLPPGMVQDDNDRGLENSRSLLVSTESEPDSSDEEGSREHREVSHNRHASRPCDLDTVDEETEPEDEDNYSFFDGRPRSI